MNLPPHLLQLMKNNQLNVSSNVTNTSNINTVPTTLQSSSTGKVNLAKSVKRIRKLKKSKVLKKKWKVVRKAGGEVWEDPSLEEWPENDFRIFCGDLGNEVTDDILANAFRKYSSFQKARVVRDKRTGKSKGFGFISFGDANDYIKVMREMSGKYVGNRPIKLSRSKWKDRCLINSKSKVESVKFKKSRKIRTKMLMNNPSNNMNAMNPMNTVNMINMNLADPNNINVMNASNYYQMQNVYQNDNSGNKFMSQNVNKYSQYHQNNNQPK